MERPDRCSFSISSRSEMDGFFYIHKDAESLTIDILTFLTGISSKESEKFPVLRKACEP